MRVERCIQTFRSPSSLFRHNSRVVSQPDNITGLSRVKTVLTILKVRRDGLEDGEEGPTTLIEAAALSARPLPVHALNRQ